MWHGAVFSVQCSLSDAALAKWGQSPRDSPVIVSVFYEVNEDSVFMPVSSL